MSRNIVLAAAAGFALAGCATTKAPTDVIAKGHNAEPLKPIATDPTSRKPVGEFPATPVKASKKAGGKPKIDRTARVEVERQELLTQMTFWAGEYAAFPDDLEAALKFSEVLRKAGRVDRALDVAKGALDRAPGNADLLRAYGLSLLSSGHSADAIRPLATLAQLDPADWRARSALGVALDEQGRYEEARRAYKEALAIKADEPSVLTNMGVSYLLGGDAVTAEKLLRQASALPSAPAEARQNLALAVGLQGRFEEAEQLQKVDLPPALVANNMAYLRGLITDDRRWGDTRKTSRQ
jgi:Flp pilus assembly protein TadD